MPPWHGPPPKGVLQGPRRVSVGSCRAALSTEKIKELFIMPGPSEGPSVLGMLQVKEQQVPCAAMAGQQPQYRADGDSLVLIHELIQRLESQGVIAKTPSSSNRPIWPVQKSLWQQGAGHWFGFTWRGVQHPRNRLLWGVETQPHHLPWAGPGCAGFG